MEFHQILFVALLVVSVQGNDKCAPHGGTCQVDSLACSGSYRSNLCPGASNVRCCWPTDRCNPLGGKCQDDNTYCSGSYHSGFCPGSAGNRCCMASGYGWVDYRGFTVSDQVVRDKLQKIAEYLNTRLWVTSGDRNGGGSSHHDVGRAADFWIDGGYSGSTIFNHIRTSGIIATDFQVIWHGSNTCTGGQHIHIGRYTDGRATCWVHEGTSSSNVCVYSCM